MEGMRARHCTVHTRMDAVYCPTGRSRVKSNVKVEVPVARVYNPGPCSAVFLEVIFGGLDLEGGKSAFLVTENKSGVPELWANSDARFYSG